MSKPLSEVLHLVTQLLQRMTKVSTFFLHNVLDKKRAWR